MWQLSERIIAGNLGERIIAGRKVITSDSAFTF